MRYAPLALLPLLLVACADQEPTAPDVSPVFSAGAGMNKELISGTSDLVGAGMAERAFTTPSGMCHLWDAPVFTHSSGSIEGPVTFNEQQHLRCDFSHLVASGPFEGEVTWNGRSGTISGQWATNCKPDASQPLGISCDGTYIARGTGGLDGVRFHVKWGPGWFPFSYTGTAFWR
ncbi:MAG: hypothetical protein GTO05_08745 [Gemmatimonadales bacterium]|nr:hypothetical protein [Gemmatimonadales bacterium]